MRSRLRLFGASALAIGLLLGATGCNKLKARDQLNKGVREYKAARYEQAIEHFKNATELDPGLNVAKLYLATAYASQYIPGVDSEDNNRMAEQAIDEYKKVLDRDSNNITSLKGIASLYFNMHKFEDAKLYHRKVLATDPNDPETYYSIGVIDWTEAYQVDQEKRASLGLKPTDTWPKKEQKTCEEVKTANEDKVRDGITMLQKALDLRKDYDDAMAYLNLLYRQKADIDCGDDAARAADLKTADEWQDKTLAIKRAKAEKQTGPGGIVLENQGQGGQGGGEGQGQTQPQQ